MIKNVCVLIRQIYFCILMQSNFCPKSIVDCPSKSPYHWQNFLMHSRITSYIFEAMKHVTLKNLIENHFRLKAVIEWRITVCMEGGFNLGYPQKGYYILPNWLCKYILNLPLKILLRDISFMCVDLKFFWRQML